jgi:hypothetical protein
MPHQATLIHCRGYSTKAKDVWDDINDEPAPGIKWGITTVPGLVELGTWCDAKTMITTMLWMTIDS